MEYTKLEYIECTGTQYINTREQIWNTSKYTNWKIDFDFTPTAAYNYNAIFGTASGDTTFESWIAADKNFYFRYNDNKQTVSTITPNTRYNFIADYAPSTLTFTINGTSRSISQSAGNIASDLYVGRRSTNYGKFKIYSLKLYGNEVLVRELIPCKYNNKIGLWDTINGSFLGNAGTGEFVAGPEQGNVTIKYTELKYIESTGTQYINTGIYPTSTSFKAEIKYQFTRTTSPGSNREAWVFSIWNGSSGWRCGCSGTSLNNVGSGFTFNNTLSTNKTIATSNACTATSSSYQVVLFGQGESGGPGHISDSLFRIYYCKIWNGDALVRDFIPCEYNGKIGLWDKISETFFANNGTGKFIAGPTIGLKTLKVKIVDKNNLFSKTVSKINGKYAKTINGVSVQCWKKKYE